MKFFFIFFVFIFFTVGFLWIVYLVFLSINQVSGKNEGILSPLAGPLEESLRKIQSLSTSSGLEKVIEPILKDTDGTYSIAIKHLDTGESYYLRENRKYESASLYKVWIMAVAFDQIQKGKLTSITRMEDTVSNLNETFKIATDDAELKEGDISLTVDEAIEEMITVSDNYAALLLSSKVRLSNVTAFLKKHQLKDSSIGTPPQTTALDMLKFFEGIYSGDIGGGESSIEMIEVLKRQKLNDRIPKYLPEEADVAHKTGELGPFKHDAGIVFSSSGPYIIVVLTETESPKDAAEVTAKISEEVYSYFEK